MGVTRQVGLLGFGSAGSIFHAPLIAATPGLELAAVVTADPDRGARVRAEHPGAEVVPDAARLWDLGLDLVVVATPNRLHVPLAREAIGRGLAVVVDKPLAVRGEDARELVAVAREAGSRLTVFQNRRWDGDFLTARRLLDDGILGSPVRFESRFERFRPEPKGGWREAAAPEEGGGQLLDLGSHLVDQARLLLGHPVRLYAEIDRRRPRPGSALERPATGPGERGGWPMPAARGSSPSKTAATRTSTPASAPGWGVPHRRPWLPRTRSPSSNCSRPPAGAPR